MIRVVNGDKGEQIAPGCRFYGMYYRGPAFSIDAFIFLILVDILSHDRFANISALCWIDYDARTTSTCK